MAKGALVIGIGPASKKGGLDDVDAEAKEEAMSDLIEAIGSKDASAAVDAFKTLYQLCKEADESEATSEGDEDEY